KSVLIEWFAKEKIDKNIQDNFFEKFANEGFIPIVDDVPLEIKKEEQELDFLDDFASEDLDSLIEDDKFIEEVESLEEAVDKSRNIEYLIQLKSDDETLNKKALYNLVEANSNLVWKVVKHYAGLSSVGLDVEDMYQVGMEGLMKAAEKFDVSLGFTFSTYAVHWIRQSITRGIADYSTLIRVPVHYREKMNKFIKMESELWNELARPATNSELSKAMDVTIDEINKIKFYIEQSNLTSLDLYVGNEEDSNLGEFIPDDDSPTPEKVLMDLDRSNVIKESLSARLTDREEEIIYYRFGFLDGGEGMTLEEIGNIYNVTRERIRQIESKALGRLRHNTTSRLLKEYLHEY